MDKIEEILSRGVANIIPSGESLRKLLETGKKLNIYLGIDPTATRIHLGHAVPLRKLAKFSELGHNVTFLIGDFTALIGDTSDKESERPVLTTEEIEENFKTYKKQAEKILDFSKIQVRNNSEWLDKLGPRDFIRLNQQFSFGDFAGRELVKKRLNASKHVGLHEGMYPAMQGYDSYFLDTDIQIGGTDQTFNMQAGRTLQKNWRDKESYVLATEFLEGSDGRKMSKTWDNAIWLSDSPNDMYRKIMAVNDDLIVKYFKLATNLPLVSIDAIEQELKKEGNPINAKKDLARQIVKELHGDKEAQDAQNNFQNTIQKKGDPRDIEEVKISGKKPIGEILILAEIATSKSEVKRLIEQGGVTLDGKTIKNSDELIENGTLKVGKHRFVKIIN